MKIQTTTKHNWPDRPSAGDRLGKMALSLHILKMQIQIEKEIQIQIKLRIRIHILPASQ